MPQLTCEFLEFSRAAITAAALADDSQFSLGDGSTDGDAIVQADGRRDVKAVRSSNDRLSDASLATFARWRNLYGVYLWNTAVTGVGFSRLEKHQHLVQVSLLGPNVNDDGVRAVSRLPHVTHLQVGNAYDTRDCKYHVHHAIVSDRALLAVASMANLAYLTIDNAAITDEGIQELASMKSVQSIQFFRCKGLTHNGLERLRVALPRVRISAHVPDLATVNPEAGCR
ncbi:MAG: hypothetical protein JXB62_13740 [Pirellulales bacterium]|nr:hypothetical protein [Pirellulales bacterium]